MATLSIRNKAKTFYCDFKYRGQRFSQDTGATRRREAEEFIKELKRQHDLTLASRQSVDRPTINMMIGDACTRYWEDKEHDLVDKDKLAWSLGWIEKYFGATTRLTDIGDNEIARMVAKRRGEFNLNHKKKQVLISKTTVNRTVIEPMQFLLARARKVWKVPVQDINWRLHTLAEPQELVREASLDEEEALFAHLKRGYADAVFFAFRMGARREECLNLEHPHIDYFNDEVTLDGKGSRKRKVKMPSDVRELLWSLKDNHPVKVFTYEAAYTRKAGKFSPATVRGERYSLTESGLEEAFETALKSAGVTNFRFHDTRHTAATQMLRATGNLRAVQNQLGHAEVKTTMKYAHVTGDDMAAAMERTQAYRDSRVTEKHTEKHTSAPLKAAND